MNDILLYALFVFFINISIAAMTWYRLRIIGDLNKKIVIIIAIILCLVVSFFLIK
jgi:hypothetical protein